MTPPGNRPPTPPRSPSPEPVYVSDSSTINISSGTESEPEGWGSSMDEEPIKKVRFNEDVLCCTFDRDQDEYKMMHEKDMKDMTKTQLNIKQKYFEYWPPKQKRLLAWLYESKRKDDSKEYALKRLKECIGVHLRVNKLNRGDDRPLTESEMPLQGITIDNFKKKCEENAESVQPQPAENVQGPVQSEPAETVQLIDPQSVQSHESVESESGDKSEKCETGNSVENQSEIVQAVPVRGQMDYYDPDGNFTVCQNKIENQMKYTEYLIYSTSMKTYLKRGLHDSDVKCISNAEGIEDDMRYCISCQVDVCLGDWPEHIKTYFHQINMKFKKRMWGCCWWKDKFIRPHQIKDCTTCQKMSQKQKTRQDMNVEDLFFYKAEADEEYLEYLDRMKVQKILLGSIGAPGTPERYSCLPSGKMNLSKEYYETHLTGRAHKEKVGKGKISTTPPTTPRPSTGSKTDKKKT